MSYTYMKYVVATKKTNHTFQMYFGCDDLQQAIQEFEKVSDPRVEQVAIFTRANWNGTRQSMKYHKNLKMREDAIPASVGMWLINQADSGHL